MGIDLSGRVAVVTGGNGGIGLGIGRALAEAGAAIAVWARDGDKSAAALAELAAGGTHASAHTVDVTREAEVAAAMVDTLVAHGRVDTMVVNAGLSLPGPYLELELEDWRRVMAVNLDGAFLCFRAAAAHMVERGDGGSLIAVSSTSALHGAPGNQAYSASKAALGALVRGLAVEFARHGIRANSIMPGWTETEMTAPLLRWDRFVEATTARTPVRRWATPDDLGPAAVFLADPAQTFHTGDCLVVDGGYTVF